MVKKLRSPMAANMLDNASALPLLEYLLEQPITTVRLVEQRLGCAYVTANKLMNHLVELGPMREVTGYQRNRRYVCEPCLALFAPVRGAEPSQANPLADTTEGR